MSESTHRTRRGITRRDFHRLGAAALVGAGLPVVARTASAAHHEAGEALVTDVAANEIMVTTLQYVNASAKADQKCSNCALYVAGEGGKGKCTLFQQGLVKETGWCLSWSPKG